jgi:dihydrofolate reductase
MQTISLIAAIARNGVIGRGAEIPWRLPADQQRFKRLTMGRPIVMGRRTHESIGRALPGRRNIVVSRRPGYLAAGCETAASFEQALALAGEGEVFVIGGADLYRAALPLADRLYLTVVDLAPEGDVEFPPYDPGNWIEIERTEGSVDERNPYAHTYVTLDRVRRS